jgi:uncharacterized protein YlxW (UPF0749 family)
MFRAIWGIQEGIMKKIASHITVALVCAFLGFMLTYEFKLLSAEGSKLISNSEVGSENYATDEIKILQNQRSELQKKNTELTLQLKNYEENMANVGEFKKEMEKQLAEAQRLMGLEDVEGSGIILTLIPKGASYDLESNNGYISEDELTYLVNVLNFAGAEAIAINNKRITDQSGIKSYDNNSYILINDEKVSPKLKMEIKALGDKGKLQSALSFLGILEYQSLRSYTSVYEPSDSIRIPKYNRYYRSEYMKRISKD